MMKKLSANRLVLPVVGLAVLGGVVGMATLVNAKPDTVKLEKAVTASPVAPISRNTESASKPAATTATPASAVSASPPAPAATAQPGEYSGYDAYKLARANGGKVVIFFAATWCETCQALDKDIRANLGSIPANVTILNANYDTQNKLEQRYGVTFQHTLVQVDASGNLLKKWDHSPTLSAVVGQII